MRVKCLAIALALSTTAQADTVLISLEQQAKSHQLVDECGGFVYPLASRHPSVLVSIRQDDGDDEEITQATYDQRCVVQRSQNQSA